MMTDKQLVSAIIAEVKPLSNYVRVYREKRKGSGYLDNRTLKFFGMMRGGAANLRIVQTLHAKFGKFGIVAAISHSMSGIPSIVVTRPGLVKSSQLRIGMKVEVETGCKELNNVRTSEQVVSGVGGYNLYTISFESGLVVRRGANELHKLVTGA